MKKIINTLLFLATFICLTQISFGNNVTEKLNTEPSRTVVFEFISDYLLADIPESYQYIELYYNDVKKSEKQYEYLQKMVYTGALPNKKINVNFHSKMNAYQFFELVKYITGYDFLTKENEDLLKNRNVKASDLVMVKEIIESGVYDEDDDKLEYYLDVLKTSEEENKMKIFFDVYHTILSEYYGSDNVDVNDLLYSGIEGLASGAGDQFSVYFPPTESKNFEESLSGEFEGIGAYIEMAKPGILTIITPIVGSPSEKAGLKGGDVIVKIDGWEIDKTTTANDAVAKIKGASGTSVVLTVLRDGETFEVKVERAKITIKDVEYKKLNNGYFYIQVKNFGDKVFNEFRSSIDALKESGEKKLIIDLRNNPGGYLEQVTDMLSLFIPKGDKTAVVKYKDFDYNYYSAGYEYLNLDDYEVYILINSGTASASEIMAGTLKDYFPKITLIGEKTYGKGSVQTMRSYYDGSMFKYTIAKWATGKNQNQIDKIGISPDVEVILDTEKFQKGEDNQLDAIFKKY
ncbi:MAG: S41 family peptidase [Candidatus Altimarinota bacterium]